MKNNYCKKLLAVFLLSLITFISINSQEVGKKSQGVSFKTDKYNINVEFYTPEIVRVVKSPINWEYTKESLSVIATPQKTRVSISERGNTVTLKSSKVIVSIDKSTGDVQFADLKENSLLKEKQNGALFTDFNDAGVKTFKVKQSFVLDEDEALYGLGILQDGKMSQRGQKKHLIQGNVEDVTTLLQSVKGYGLFWDNYSPTDFSDDLKETYFESTVGDCIDYYFMYGGNADGVIANIRTLTGEVPMFPLWTYGYWQSRERYKSQFELLEVVNKHRELNVPLDGIIQDWQYWGSNYLWNAMDFLNEEFPNPQGMIDEVHSKNANIIISIWSSFGPMTKAYQELKEKDLLLNFITWPQSGSGKWPPRKDYPSGVRPYDPYSPEGRDIYWNNLTRLHNLDIDGWWMDSTEPDHLDFKPEDLNIQTHLGSFRKVRNAYPLMTVGGVYDNQRATSSDKRVFILTRSFFQGQQRYGANVWTGDVRTSWETLRRQIPAGLNFTLTGNPNFNTDIGGFFVGDYNHKWNHKHAPENPFFQELYVRWMQYGAFSPMMRSHGTDIKREFYFFGEEGETIYDAIVDAIDLRYSLLPYIYSTSWEVTDKQGSFMRALMMDFPQDKNVWDMKYQFMFGKSLLVAPVIQPQYTSENILTPNEYVAWSGNNNKDNQGLPLINFDENKYMDLYLPQGSAWYDFYTNKKYNGGQEIKYETSINKIPLFAKAGSIIPIGPKVQYATEKAWNNLEIKIYEGDNGSFILYEDEFDNYNYEEGKYTEIPFSWNDSNKSVTIGKRKGSYEGMLTSRKFTIILQNGNTKTVNYNGKKVVVKMR